MSEGQEKTEQATPRRRQDARRKGQAARSPELSGAVVLLVTLVTFRAALGNSGLLPYLRAALSTAHEHVNIVSAGGGAAGIYAEVGSASREALMTLLRAVGLSVTAGCAAGVAANLAQVGLLWTTHPLIPDPARLNPISGLSRLLGVRGLVEATKALLKVLVIGWVAYATVRGHLPDLVALSTLPTSQLLASFGNLLYRLCLRVTLVFVGIALLDYAYQRWDFEKSLRMSKEEIKQEHKQSEGDPLLKHAIRQRQRAAASRRMMQDVPKADVIITNPTHFAVALAYHADSMRAPRVLAKGQDAVAARIRETAREHDVPLVENPPLARALHKEVEIGHEIPAALYAAVAEVLAYVYERNKAFPGRTTSAGSGSARR